MNHCGLCETPLRPDTHDRYLCPGCQDATAGRLSALPLLYGDLAGHLAPGSPAPGPRASGSSSSASLPVSEPVLGLRGPGGIVGVLEDWRSALHNDRGWTEPHCSGSVEDRVARAAKSLRACLPWIAAAWPMAGAMTEEIRDLHRDVLSIVAPGDPSGPRIGYCVAATGGGSVCGAVLRARPGMTSLPCDWCGYVYESGDFMMLAELQPNEVMA